jgi:hypothetical protein
MAHESSGHGGAELRITIEYDDSLTRFDLDEILSSIDRIIESARFYLEPEFSLRSRWSGVLNWYGASQATPNLTYVGIRAIEPGSLEILAFIGGAVVSYGAQRFRKGVDSSILGKELERSGRLFGGLVGPLVASINNWGERYVPYQKELGGKVKRISARVADSKHKAGR